MSILDDAIREHLELKRAHGADEMELKRLEDEAFGPPGRPDEEGDAFADAPTEFLGATATEVAEPPDAEGGRRMPNLTDLQEPPQFPPEGGTEGETAEAATIEPETPSASAPETEAPPAPEAPAEEQHPAMEHETIPGPPPPSPESPAAPAAEAPAEPEPESGEEPAAEAPVDSGPSTEEREAIAEQPTQFFDVEAELTAGPEPEPEQREEEPAAASSAEESAAPETPGELELGDEQPSEEYEEDDFFSEQRLSDELNQALEAPVTDEHEALPEPEPLRQPEPREPDTPPPAARADEPTQLYDFEEDEDDDEEDGDEDDAYEPKGEHEDVLEDTPDFLENGADDDEWFEQRPPKDFDFDD